MRSPWRWVQELYLLGHQQGPELRGKAFGEIFVGRQTCPMCATVGIIVELPKMYKFIDRARVALEITDELLVLSSLLKCRKADLLIELYCLCHLADVQHVG